MKRLLKTALVFLHVPLRGVAMTVAPRSELRLRVISALVLVVVAIVAIWQGGLLFQAFWGLAAIVCFFEWISVSITGVRPLQYVVAAFTVLILSTQPVQFNPTLIASLALSLAFAAFFSPSNRRIWAPLGLIYAGAFVFSMTALRASPALGFIAVFWLCVIVWISDVCAFFVGRRVGGPKLLPTISPKKTWSGFLGGIAGGVMASLVVLLIAGLTLKWQHLVLAALLSVAAAAGDLLESGFKRYFGVKDSGASIPGHGGVLDRIDGLMAAVVIAALIGLGRNADMASGLLRW